MTTQLDCSIGLALETTYGTAVTPTKFLEFTDESLNWDPTFLQGKGLRVGSRVARLGRRPQLPGKQMGGGDVEVEAGSKGLGVLLAAALGAVTTTQRAATGVFQQNHTLSATDPLSSYTLQKGIAPLGGGVIVPHTFRGAVCEELELTCGNGDFVMVKTSWNAKDVDTATAYAAPSYPTPVENFVFAGGAIALGGTVVAPTTTALATGGTTAGNILDASVKISNNIDDGGFTFGAGGKRGRRPAVGMADISGKVTAEFDSITLRDLYLTQADLGLLLTFLGTTTIGTGTDKPALQVWIPAIRLEGDVPDANGGDVSTQDIAFTCLDNLSQAPITISYASTDTAP